MKQFCYFTEENSSKKTEKVAAESSLRSFSITFVKTAEISADKLRNFHKRKLLESANGFKKTVWKVGRRRIKLDEGN